MNLTFALDAAIGAITNVLRDLNVDEYKIRQVVEALSEGSEELGDNSFHRNARISPASFGGTEAAQALGNHHQRAHMVIDETIRGMVRDLEAFRDNVRNAVELVSRADETAAGDLDARRQRVADAMTYVVQNSAADQAHNEARNNQLGGSD